jgi:hypothetical protein
VKLADFGLSKRRTEETAFRTYTGTQAYMAPEILNYIPGINPETSEYTNAVDIWALGCIVYRLASGVVPFPPGPSLVTFCADESKFPSQGLELSEPGNKFVRDLVVPYPSRRLTAQQALDHAWTKTSRSGSETSISNTRHQIRQSNESGTDFFAGYNTGTHAGLQSYGPAGSIGEIVPDLAESRPPRRSYHPPTVEDDPEEPDGIPLNRAKTPDQRQAPSYADSTRFSRPDSQNMAGEVEDPELTIKERPRNSNSFYSTRPEVSRKVATELTTEPARSPPEEYHSVPHPALYDLMPTPPPSLPRRHNFQPEPTPSLTGAQTSQPEPVRPLPEVQNVQSGSRGDRDQGRVQGDSRPGKVYITPGSESVSPVDEKPSRRAYRSQTQLRRMQAPATYYNNNNNGGIVLVANSGYDLTNDNPDYDADPTSLTLDNLNSYNNEPYRDKSPFSSGKSEQSDPDDDSDFQSTHERWQNPNLCLRTPEEAYEHWHNREPGSKGSSPSDAGAVWNFGLSVIRKDLNQLDDEYGDMSSLSARKSEPSDLDDNSHFQSIAERWQSPNFCVRTPEQACEYRESTLNYLSPSEAGATQPSSRSVSSRRLSPSPNRSASKRSDLRKTHAERPVFYADERGFIDSELPPSKWDNHRAAAIEYVVNQRTVYPRTRKDEREPSKVKSPTAVGDLDRKHGNVDREAVDMHPQVTKDNRRRTEQVQYIEPQSQARPPEPPRYAYNVNYAPPYLSRNAIPAAHPEVSREQQGRYEGFARLARQYAPREQQQYNR